MREQSGKSRALRIRLDYYKQKGWLYWSRWLAAGTALVGCGGYALLVLISVWQASHAQPSQLRDSPWLARGLSQLNTGPLSAAHSHFESDCFACHSRGAWQPIASDALQLQPQFSSSRLSMACQRCHAVESHLSTTLNAQCQLIDQNCSTCHREHQGRQIDLTALSSQHCTQCHADLSRSCSDQRTVANLNIADFTTASHAVGETQQFRSLLQDPGRIRFDHAQHMQPGQIENHDRGGFRHAMLTERWQAKYGQDANGLVQLQCASCHQLQSPSSLSSASSAMHAKLSHFYAPIDYEQHCVACHQLTFTGQTADMLPLPHAAPRAEVMALLSAKLQGGKISGSIRTPDTSLPKDMPASPSATWVEAELQSAVANVFQRCEQCHLPQDVSAESMQSRWNGAAMPPMIPNSWLQHGLFDHAPHQQIDCQFCHPLPTSTAEFAGKNRPPDDNLHVMIRGPASCTPCHRDPSITPSLDLSSGQLRRDTLGFAQQPDLASDNCTHCHRYHWSRPLAAAIPGLNQQTGVTP